MNLRESLQRKKLDWAMTALKALSGGFAVYSGYSLRSDLNSMGCRYAVKLGTELSKKVVTG